MLKALYEVVGKAGSNMSETSRDLILGLIDGERGGADGDYNLCLQTNSANLHTDKMNITYARLLGVLIKSLPAAFNASSLIK